uniref:XK-related protein n=1 Tax=Neolamprologus brichardi TaxID=32507 RepID=A0A3Q4HBI9_NEOBR
MSGTQANFKYSCWDFLFTCVGLPLFMLDIGLDIWTAVSFYKEKAYVCLAVLLFLLLGSSLLTQAYSWLWYSYDNFEMKTNVEKLPSPRQLKLLHVFQLGIYFSFLTKLPDPEGVAVFLSHDLSMLRISADLGPVCLSLCGVAHFTTFLFACSDAASCSPSVLKAVGSASAIAFTVTTYHRSLRFFLPAKENQKITSSVICFIWNLVLISSRLTALALFASVLPCFIFAHFICSWLVLFFFAWRSKTDFMESPCGEWLYRATVGIIWYFNWFNVAEGKTRYRTVLYHGYILTDICILCAVWCWKMSTDPPDFVIEPMHALITVACVVAVYILGLILKVIYYKVFHPNLDKDELKGASTEQLPEDEVGFRMFAVAANMADHHPSDPSAHCNKRMRKLAENFYS